jgi:hypothetical protein
MTSFELVVPAFDPGLHPIGYALAAELFGAEECAEEPVVAEVVDQHLDEVPPAPLAARAFGPLPWAAPEPEAQEAHSPEESWFCPVEPLDDAADEADYLVRRAG